VVVKKVIGVVDHGSANLASLGNALERIGANFNFVSNPDEMEAYDAYILPGVGAFAHGMGSLEAIGMNAVLLDVVRQGKDVLGICLGMQFLFDDSEEGVYHKGLGIISGNVKRINATSECRLPHMGWNNLEEKELGHMRLFNGIDRESSYYFVHSYCVTPRKHISSAYTNYCGASILGAFEHENLYGAQFHPEKSHDAGLRVLDNYCNR
jgi:glutamine amidotransferase